ncbi:MAG: ABC transporter permease [Armatimonadetes bacterium]|nr:ABC transporter permease [Armatimonadota bacterium]
MGSIGWPGLTVIGTLALWEIGVRAFRVPEFVLPTPSAVLAEVWREQDRLLGNAVVTLWAVLAGFGLGVAVGAPLAFLIVYSRTFERAVYPLLVFSQTIPKISIIPVFVVWFGFGLLPKVLIAFLICFFPVVIDTVVGLRSVPPEAVDLIRSMGGSRMDVFTRVRIPNALPYFFSGLKVAVTLALVGGVVGEFVGSTSGLGFLIVQASGLLNNRLVFAGILVLSAIGVVLFYAVDLLERLLLPWHVTRRVEFTP